MDTAPIIAILKPVIVFGVVLLVVKFGADLLVARIRKDSSLVCREKPTAKGRDGSPSRPHARSASNPGLGYACVRLARRSSPTSPRKWAIELDDRSHNRKDRIACDHFLNKAMEEASVPLLRFQTQSSYTTDQIAQKIASRKQKDAA